MSVNKEKLDAFLSKAVADLGAANSAVLVLLGDELGLYKALAKESLTPAELGARTGTHERYMREWLGNQAAGGYVDFDAASGKYRLNASRCGRIGHRACGLWGRGHTKMSAEDNPHPVPRPEAAIEGNNLQRPVASFQHR